MSVHGLISIKSPPSAPLRLSTGIVRQESGVDFTVVVESSAWTAHVAAGCLMRPEVGDTVLLLEAEADELFILNVLHRPSAAPAVIQNKDGLVLSAPRIALEATRELTVDTPKSRFLFGETTIGCAAAAIKAKAATFVAGTLRTLAGTIEQTAEQLLTQASDRTTLVSGIDTLDAKAANTRIETSLVIQTGSTVLTAEGDVKMDAERISLG